MRSGTTSTGFAYEYDEQRLDDMRFVDVLAVVIDPNAGKFARVSGLSELIRMLLGTEMKQKLYDHIGESNDGRVPREDLEKALKEIMGATGEPEIKN